MTIQWIYGSSGCGKSTLARVLDRQGFNVVVSTICPTPELRSEVYAITGCTFIHIEDTRDIKSW